MLKIYLNGELEQSVYDVAIVNPEVKPSSVIVNASLRKAFRELKIMNRPLDYKKNKNICPNINVALERAKSLVK